MWGVGSQTQCATGSVCNAGRTLITSPSWTPWAEEEESSHGYTDAVLLTTSLATPPPLRRPWVFFCITVIYVGFSATAPIQVPVLTVLTASDSQMTAHPVSPPELWGSESDSQSLTANCWPLLLSSALRR